MAEMERIETLVHREQAVFVGRYGDTHVSGNWSRVYEAADRSRTDKFYESTDESTFGDNSPDSVLVEVTWKVPDGEDLKAYHVSHEHKCYTVTTAEGGAYKRDPMKRLRWYVGLLGKADRVLDTKTLDGRECVGFEIDTSKYGSNPKGRTDRIWFDVETKLPVRIERHGLPVTDSPGRTFTFIDDRFEYHAQVPADKFVPKIPDGYVNASTHEIRAEKEKEEKGDLLYADVPGGLRDQVAAALRAVVTATYKQRYAFMRNERWAYSDGSKLYIAPHAWREDDYSGDQVSKTDFFVTDMEDWGKTSFDFNDRAFKLTQTTVDFNSRNYAVVTHGSQSHPNNPMDRIIRIASMLNKADQFWEKEIVNGIECFGFELSAKKYGSNPDTHKHRMWFDKLTKLPVRTEFEWVQTEGARRQIREQFQWNPAFDAETFKPEIPENFAVKEQN
jgi:outer membrane lipoprotein-sorting protein